MKKFLLEDLDLPETRPLSRFRAIFSQRDGIFSTIERIENQHKDAEIYFSHPISEYSSIVCNGSKLILLNQENVNESSFDQIIKSSNLSLFKLLDRKEINNRIENDLNSELIDKTQFISYKYTIEGDFQKLFVHKNLKILPNVVFDTREGVIVIDEHVEISPFSYLAGPLYIGKHSKIDNARITGGCIVGHHVRLGGEIENCLINDFTNKHHEGFIGHSILGSWVNLGALTTTSDLKNNYGEVRLSVPVSYYPNLDEMQTISTKTDKFGSIIGDCVKTAIGIMLNTGTVIDAGCNVFGKNPGKYMPPMTWGDCETKYNADLFIRDCIKIFGRRNQKIGINLKALVENLLVHQNDDIH